MLDGGPLMCWPRIDKSELIDMDEMVCFVLVTEYSEI